MSASNRGEQHWPFTRWARAFLSWCEGHPLPLFVGAMVALFSVAQGIDWAAGKLWPPLPRILNVEEGSEAGANFSITIENPKDIAVVVSGAIFRSEPPIPQNVNAVELVIPAVTYDVPLDCAPGTKHIKLNPPFKVAAKDVGAVVFRSTRPIRPCRLYVSLETSQGLAKEKEGVSLARWRTRPTS